MTESYKYDTAGWHLLHTDNDGNFITGDDAVTITTGANGDISEGGLWKLTANGANEFARIPNNVPLTSDNWEAGDRDDILPNTVYWVYTGVIAQAEVTSYSVEIATRYVADVSNSYWHKENDNAQYYPNGITEVYIKNPLKRAYTTNFQLGTAYDQLAYTSNNNSYTPPTSFGNYWYDYYLDSRNLHWPNITTNYAPNSGTAGSFGQGTTYNPYPLFTEGAFQWNPSSHSGDEGPLNSPDTQNKLIMIGDSSSTGLNPSDSFNILFHIPGKVNLSVLAMNEYVAGTGAVELDPSEYNVKMVADLTENESGTVPPTIT